MSTTSKKAKVENEIYSSFCFNPFNKMKHRSSDMRNISDGLLKKFPTLSKRLKICGSCRKELWKLNELANLNSNEPCAEVIPDEDKSNSENEDTTVDDDDGYLTFQIQRMSVETNTISMQ